MKIVGVKINNSGKTLYYNDNDLNLKINLTVIVNSDRGLQFGTVTEFSDDENFDKYEDVIRIASKKDYLQHLKNQEDEKRGEDPLQFAGRCAIIFRPYRNEDWVPCDLSV